MATSEDHANMAMQVSVEEEVRANASSRKVPPIIEVMEHVSEQQFADLAAGDPLPEKALAHLKKCHKCQARRDHHVSTTAAVLLTVQPDAVLDTESALTKLRKRIARMVNRASDAKE